MADPIKKEPRRLSPQSIISEWEGLIQQYPDLGNVKTSSGWLLWHKNHPDVPVELWTEKETAFTELPQHVIDPAKKKEASQKEKAPEEKKGHLDMNRRQAGELRLKALKEKGEVLSEEEKKEVELLGSKMKEYEEEDAKLEAQQQAQPQRRPSFLPSLPFGSRRGQGRIPQAGKNAVNTANKVAKEARSANRVLRIVGGQLTRILALSPFTTWFIVLLILALMFGMVFFILFGVLSGGQGTDNGTPNHTGPVTSADFSIDGSADAHVDSNNPIHYSISATYKDAEPADIEIDDVIPANAVFESSSTSQAFSYDAGSNTVSFVFRGVASGQTVSVSFVLNPTQDGTISNPVSARFAQGSTSSGTTASKTFSTSVGAPTTTGNAGIDFLNSLKDACGSVINLGNWPCAIGLFAQNVFDIIRTSVTLVQGGVLQCVGFVMALAAHLGQPFSFGTDAWNFAGNPPAGYSYIQRGDGPMQPGDF